MIAAALEKINTAMADCQEKRVPAEPIVKYLLEKCGEDEELAGLVIQEHKTLGKCFEFVYEQVKNHLDSKDGWVEDNDVYLMALDYFNLDDAELERRKEQEQAQREQERRQREQEYQRKADELKEQKARETKQKALAKKYSEDQLSLFGEEDA